MLSDVDVTQDYTTLKGYPDDSFGCDTRDANCWNVPFMFIRVCVDAQAPDWPKQKMN